MGISSWGRYVLYGSSLPFVHTYHVIAGYADITEVVVVLNSDAAVQAFSQGGNVTIGGERSYYAGSSCCLHSDIRCVPAGGLSISAGPIGTGAQLNASLAHPAPMFSYTRSKGMLMFPTS
jgi:lipid-binding SYLF domain-containing protein